MKNVQRKKLNAYVRSRVLKRDDMTCNGCGFQADLMSQVEVDHILPIAKGGQTELDNLHTLCVPCHRLKTRRQVSRRARVNPLTGFVARA